jgi:hypothetical protein
MPEGFIEFGTVTLDASQPVPPPLPTASFYADWGEFLSVGIWVDQLVIPHFTTNPDPAAWPSGAVWPPHPPNPIGDSVWKRYSNSSITLSAGAWDALRRRSSVYGFLLSGPRTSLPFGATYNELVSIWRKGRSTYWPILHHNPVADAGPSGIFPVTANGGLRTNLTLDGSGSAEPDGDPLLSYTWTMVSGPPGAAKLPWRPLVGSQVDALPAGTAVPADALGVYTFRLTVTDAFGSSTADVIHSIVRVNAGPIADAGPPFQVFRLLTGRRAKEAVVVDASGSSDPDGDPLTYTWRQLPPVNPEEVPLLPAPVTSSPTFR